MLYDRFGKEYDPKPSAVSKAANKSYMPEVGARRSLRHAAVAGLNGHESARHSAEFAARLRKGGVPLLT
jgi:hypothetical protein